MGNSWYIPQEVMRASQRVCREQPWGSRSRQFSETVLPYAFVWAAPSARVSSPFLMGRLLTVL